MEEDQTEFFKGYTSIRLLVQLVWSTDFPTLYDAFVFERQIKGWSRAKKQALIRGDWNGIYQVVTKERREHDAKKRVLRLRPPKNQADSAQND